MRSGNSRTGGWTAKAVRARACYSSEKSGEPNRTPTNGDFPHVFKDGERDTSRKFSPLQVNSLAERSGHSTFRPVHDYAVIFLDRIEENARRQAAGRQLINAALNCGADAARFLEIIHAHLSAGHPIPNSYRLMTEAREWASWASTAENKAYALACYEAMPPADQAAFLRHVSGQVAA